jgi:hypothetical protein
VWDSLQFLRNKKPSLRESCGLVLVVNLLQNLHETNYKAVSEAYQKISSIKYWSASTVR